MVLKRSSAGGTSLQLSGVRSDYSERCASESYFDFVHNLTTTFIDKSNEASMVSGSVLMFILAGMFFNLNLFSGVSDVSAILDPSVRLILSSALSLLLPVMSYLFSEAKNGEQASSLGGPGSSSSSSAADGNNQQQQTDLPLQAGVILVWMLLVELLRKKVDVIRMQGFSSNVQRAGRVVWLGSLVFVNIHSSGRRIVYGVLWILCATTFLQRFAFNEFEKRSFARGKNARLIAYYMAHILPEGGDKDDIEQEQRLHVISADGDIEQHAGTAGPDDDDPELLFKKCRYIVMGEDHLVKEATADGYKLNVKGSGTSSASVVTVGDVWRLPDSDTPFAGVDKRHRLRRLCLSFALFKLLRRRFEHHEPPSKEETRNSRELIFKGLYHDGDSTAAEAVFQVINDEVNFLSEYYHSVVPVIFASPFFFLTNYLVLPVVVFGLCVLTVILCGNGDVRYSVTSIREDNASLRAGIGNLTICLIKNFTHSPKYFFSLLDISITFLLFAIFLYESLWEMVVFILSNWFTVSLVCNYTAQAQEEEESWGKPIFRWAFHWIPCVRSWMSHGDLSFKQFSVLSLRLPHATALPFIKQLPVMVPSTTVPSCIKESILKYFVAHYHVVPISFGKSALEKIDGMFSNLSWAFGSKSIAEVTLTWHIATEIFEQGSSSSWSQTLSTKKAADFSKQVATGLSRYCAYLVVFHPELLPDNQDNTEHVVELMKEELRESLGFLEFYFFGQAARVRRIMQLKGEESWTENKVVKNGVTLGASLLEKVFVGDSGDGDGDDENDKLETMTWKMLANVWTELMAYIVPSTDEERLKGHENALVQGGDFITVLWALSTHTGISRQRQPM